MFFPCDQAMAQLVHKIVILALAALRAGFCAPLASLPGHSCALRSRGSLRRAARAAPLAQFSRAPPAWHRRAAWGCVKGKSDVFSFNPQVVGSIPTGPTTGATFSGGSF